MDSGKVGGFISTLRKDLGMTQQDLANRLNVTNKAVSKWETGEGYPEITMLPALADILGVSVDELLRGARNDPPEPGHAAVGGETNFSDWLERAKLQFRNMRVISAAIAVTGLVAFYVITLTSYYELIGFGVMAAFLACSFILFIVKYNALKTAEAKSGLHCDDIRVNRSMITLIYFWSVPLAAALPYLVYDDGTYMRSILSFQDYVHILPAF